MSGSTFGQQTKALVQKSWTFQKRNIGSNICLCVAPIFFCVILAIIQVLVNRLFLSSDSLKCGCYCQQCCPTWALTSKPNNFTANGNGTVTITNISTFPNGYRSLLQNFLPTQITNNTDGSITVQTCTAVGSGACPIDQDYSCLATDSNQCGVQFSTPSQAQWCAVPQPSVWPGVLQTPANDRRAKPWGSVVVNGVPNPQPATLVTSSNLQLTQTVSNNLFPGVISNDVGLWSKALLGPNGLNTGNSSDPNLGNIYNGDWLSRLGLQFGSSGDAQISLYIERAFQTGQTLYVMFPLSTCVSKKIPTDTTICMAELLRLYFADDPTLQPVLATLPSCIAYNPLLGQNNTKLLNTLFLGVVCTENAIVPTQSMADLENILYCGYYQARCNASGNWYNNMYGGAYDLLDSSNSLTGGALQLDMSVYYNQTLGVTTGGGPQRVMRIPGALNVAVAAWWTALTGETNTGVNPSGVELLGVASMPKASSTLDLDFSTILGPLFFTWVVQLLLPTFLQQLVYEKEKRLRMMMKMHGLRDPVYWVVTYIWYLILYVIYIIIFIIIGAIVRLNQFRKTNLGIQVIFYFLHGNCMIAFAFMLSSLFTSSRTAIMVAFLYVFGTGLIGQLLLTTFIDQNKGWMFFVEWVPAFSLFRGLYEISVYTFLGVYRGEPGMQFKNLSDEGNGMVVTWAIFIVEWFVFMVVGLYLEQVVSSGTGIRRHPLFFLPKWMKGKKATPQASLDHDHDHRTSLDGKLQHMALSMARDDVAPGASDVQAEAARVNALTDYEDTPIVMKDICKIYPALDGGKPKTAVRSMTVGITRGECFGLLGPNGAGKTTSINMLTGFLEPTRGTGIVEGFDIRKDMASIYALMGVCPQHDLLWEQLSAREHLRFYGRLKGMNGVELDDAIDAALKSVNLYNAGVGDKYSGKYSGGMKRRLSVAISFMGEPKVVYLDEPSTGLDPASRRNLWDVVKSGKTGRSIILTTHSMEEAEMLCDRLGIFVDGQLVCIGNPKEITSRYAGFYVFTISVPPSQEVATKQLVTSMSPNAVLTYELGGTFKYELPTGDVSLSQVFSTVNASKDRIDIIDWGIASATLEEVFIKLAKGIGAKSEDH